MSKPEVSDTKLKLQRIINHISCLESHVNNGDLKNVSLIQQQLEADFNHLEQLPLHKINTEIKRRHLKRKAAKARSKLHKTIVSKSNQTNTKSITSTATNELTSSDNSTPPSVPSPPPKTHRQLRNYHTAQGMLRTFELLKKLHYARCQDLEATRKLSANLHQLEARWADMLHQNQPQHTQQSKLDDQWDVALFGPKQYNLHNTGVLAKNSSDLLEIRHTWDSYLTNSKMHGTSIPTGWVLPHVQADERWLAYRKIP